MINIIGQKFVSPILQMPNLNPPHPPPPTNPSISNIAATELSHASPMSFYETGGKDLIDICTDHWSTHHRLSNPRPLPPPAFQPIQSIQHPKVFSRDLTIRPPPLIGGGFWSLRCQTNSPIITLRLFDQSSDIGARSVDSGNILSMLLLLCYSSTRSVCLSVGVYVGVCVCFRLSVWVSVCPGSTA